MSALVAWFLGTRLGRWLAIAGGVVLAVVTFGAWQRREGAKAAQQHQKDADHEAARKGADAARVADRVPDPVDELRRGWSREPLR